MEQIVWLPKQYYLQKVASGDTALLMVNTFILIVTVAQMVWPTVFPCKLKKMYINNAPYKKCDSH